MRARGDVEEIRQRIHELQDRVERMQERARSIQLVLEGLRRMRLEYADRSRIFREPVS